MTAGGVRSGTELEKPRGLSLSPALSRPRRGLTAARHSGARRAVGRPAEQGRRGGIRLPTCTAPLQRRGGRRGVPASRVAALPAAASCGQLRPAATSCGQLHSYATGLSCVGQALPLRAEAGVSAVEGGQQGDHPHPLGQHGGVRGQQEHGGLVGVGVGGVWPSPESRVT